jgi:1,2-diacylglycerol 3-alpha-glucosyltransferase/glucuronosyltransferase
MRISIVSDAWFPQVNGVVTTLSTVGNELVGMGHQVQVVSPDRFKTIPCPTYPEIRLAVGASKRVENILDSARASAIHIATEGPLGLAARSYCLRRKIPFTTSFHTRFPEYLHARTRIPVCLTYRVVRWFHAPAQRTLVATQTLRQELSQRGFQNLVSWYRGVDTERFRPRNKGFLTFRRPIYLYVGRLAVEKNIRAFLDLNLGGTKLVVGDGPESESLASKYPEAHFTGAKFGEELARYYAASDVFVFPSRTDTFGLVMLEALASGIPVAAHPVAGPKDVIGDSHVGVLSEDLGQAAVQCLKISPSVCREFALQFSWKACAESFVRHLEPAGHA